VGRADAHTTYTDTWTPLSELVRFLPKQWQAWEAMWEVVFVLYGGARGPGKSYWLRWALLTFLLRCYVKLGLRKVRVGLFCETYPELRDRQISKIELEFPVWLGEVKDTEVDGLAFILRDEFGGGRLLLRNLDDPKKYQSAEFAAIAVDELTQTTYETFAVLRGSLRWPGVDHRPFIAATNPGGIGHAWVKQLWVDRNPPRELAKRRDQFRFIQALPKDNPYLDEAYWEELNSLPENLRAAWVDGNWDIFEGQAFTGWNRDRHVIRPRQIPDHWVKWRALDWGFAAPFCCLWFAKNPDNSRIFVYREIYETGLIDRQQARAILDNTAESEKIKLTYAPPELWAKKAMQDSVSSTVDEYLHEGLVVTPADNDRVGGKRKVDRLLMSLPDGEPGLVVFSTCANLIRTLPALPYDKVNVEDVDTDAEDHAYDALKYGLTKLAAPKKAEPELPKRKGGIHSRSL